MKTLRCPHCDGAVRIIADRTAEYELIMISEQEVQDTEEEYLKEFKKAMDRAIKQENNE